MRSTTIGPAIFLGLYGLLIGCTGSLPITHYYTLRQPQEFVVLAKSAALEGLTIGVDTFVVDPPYDQDRLVYRTAPNSSEVGFYAYHRWASPLGRLVAVALAEGLSGTDGVASIKPATSAGTYDAHLGGRVIYLEEIDRPTSQEARIALDLRLVDTDGNTLWSQSLASSASGQAESTAEIMHQMTRAFEDVVNQVREGLSEALNP
jgi:uncharacterized lipoprotein YmbA